MSSIPKTNNLQSFFHALPQLASVVGGVNFTPSLLLELLYVDVVSYRHMVGRTFEDFTLC